MEPLLSTIQVAEYLGVPPATVRHWRLFKTGPRAHKIGAHVKYRPRDVELWLSKRADPDPDAPVVRTRRR